MKKALGDVNRYHQYDSYVIPLSPEEKIEITQKAHKGAQKDLNKAMKCIKRAIDHYFKSYYGSSKVFELLTKEHQNILNLKEKIKKETYNALPYKELDQQGVKETEFTDSRLRLSLKAKLLGIAAVFNGLLYAYGWFFNRNIFAVAIMFSMISVGLLYFRWTKKTQKTLNTGKTKVW